LQSAAEDPQLSSRPPVLYGGGGGGDGFGDGSGCVGSRTRQRTVVISRAIYMQYAIYIRFILILLE